MSVAFQYASRVTTVGLEFALPPLAGSFLDKRWSLSPLATILGAVVGFAIGMMQHPPDRPRGHKALKPADRSSVGSLSPL